MCVDVLDFWYTRFHDIGRLVSDQNPQIHEPEKKQSCYLETCKSLVRAKFNHRYERETMEG